MLGVILFAIEILWFILLPMARESKAWWEMRHEIAASRRSVITGVVSAVGLAGLLVPWSGTVATQGIVTADQHYRFFAPKPARIETIAIRDGQIVSSGEIAFTLAAPDIEREAMQARRRIAASEARLSRIAGDATDLTNKLVLEGELARDRSTLAGLQKELARLVVKAPSSGMIKELDPYLQRGEWISETKPMARLVGQGKPQIVTYVDEQDVRRLTLGASAIFIPDDPFRPKLDGLVVEIAPAGARALEYVQLASVFGGAIPSDREPNGDVKPRSGRHLVRIALTTSQTLQQTQRGIVRLTAARESIATSVSRRALQVLIRESGA